MTTTLPTATSTSAGGIDMLTPVETCLALGLIEAELLALVNAGELAAYRLGPHLRFRSIDVRALRSTRAAA